MGILYPDFFIDMKKLSRRTKICSVIFIFLIITALLVSRPIYRKLEDTVNKFTKQIIENVYENTGIILSYESFSPSILASFRINNIIAKDENGKEIYKMVVTIPIDEIPRRNTLKFKFVSSAKNTRP